MNKFQDTLVVIPARGKSKRIPKKNIKKICGKPMISWPIIELKKIFRTSQILVSTEDKNIKFVVKKFGIDTKYTRPKNLSGDKVGIIETVKHATNWYEKNFKKVNNVLIVYPTAVFLNIKKIKLAFQILYKDKRCNAVFAAMNYGHPIQRAFYQKQDNYIKMFNSKNFKMRSQDTTNHMHDAAQFSFCKKKAIDKRMNLMNAFSKVIKIPRYSAVDIDNLEDFKLAEILMKLNKICKKN